MRDPDAVYLDPSPPLRSQVSAKFTKARASHHLIFSDTEVAVLHNTTGIPFQVRFCPALSQKPQNDKHSSSHQRQPEDGVQHNNNDDDDSSKREKRHFDPFEDPSPDLLIMRLPDSESYSHNLVLNKFPIIPNHCILATRENKPQTDLLEDVDLAMVHACLKAWDENDDKENERNAPHKLYAFFNSGNESGASQPHRHIQFLPFEDMQSSISRGDWEPMYRTMQTWTHSKLPILLNPDLPIVHARIPLNREMTPKQLLERYHMLLEDVTTRFDLSCPNRNVDLDADLRMTDSSGRPRFSYNLAMTTRDMILIPRRAGSATVPIPGIGGDTTTTGRVSINGTFLAGTMMVKNKDEWDILKAKPHILDDIIQQVGFPYAQSKI